MTLPLYVIIFTQISEQEDIYRAIDLILNSFTNTLTVNV